MSALHFRVPNHDNVFVRGDLAGELRKLLPDHIEPLVREYMKNNASYRTGVSFQPEESLRGEDYDGFTPVIYVDPFEAPYENGEISMSDIAVIVTEEYYKYMDCPPGPPDFVQSFAKAADRLAFKLKNTRRNKEFLEGVPHVDILDLSLVFFYLAETDDHGMYVCTITEDMRRDWGVDTETIYRKAMENAPRLLPPLFRPLSSMIAGTCETDDDDDTLMYVLANTGHANGAASMMYEGLLSEVCETLGDDIYILPSSVHELIVIRASDAANVTALREIVADVNATAVHPEDFLSDSVYYFSRCAGILEYA